MAGVVAILGILAFLQYRWTLQISDNEQDRMRTQLRTAIGQFRQDFYRDLVTTGAVFQVDPDSSADTSRFNARYQEWLRNPVNAAIVSNVYIWDAHPGKPTRELRFDRDAEEFSPDAFPPAVKRCVASEPWHAPGGMIRRTAWTFDPSLPGMIRPLYFARPRGNRPGPTGRENRQGRERAEGRQFPWARENREPREDRGSRGPRSPEDAAGPQLIGAIGIALNSNFLIHQLFPALTQRHLVLSGATYHVSIYPTTDPSHSVFEAGPKPPGEAGSKPDAEANLIESPFVQNRPQNQRVRVPGEPAPPAAISDPLRPPPLRRFATAFPIALIPGSTQWRLAVQHPSGSLKAAVEPARRANLLMSFGALVILAGSIALLFASIYRTRALARMQMEFVAGVSHELRTPVSVICSAADNLAEGVVESRPQVQNYGQLIRGEARRLGTMVEQILMFSTKSDTARFNLQPQDVASIIEIVLRDTEPGIAAAGMTLERAIDPELPYAIGDAGAITRCLQNLISNAVKYGSSGHWVRISGFPSTHRGKAAVSISIEDRGIGIPAPDIKRIFEPFYRGKAALDSQVHGTGLGLSLARELARAMRGDILVVSHPEQGSRFTLVLPAADMPAVNENESVNEPVHTAD